MPNTYKFRLTYSFVLLNKKPFHGTYQGWYTYLSDTLNGTFPNQYGQVTGVVYLAPFFFPLTPGEVGRIETIRAQNLVVAGGKVTQFGGSFDLGPLSMNLSQSAFDFAYQAAEPIIRGSGSVYCEPPKLVP